MLLDSAKLRDFSTACQQDFARALAFPFGLAAGAQVAPQDGAATLILTWLTPDEEQRKASSGWEPHAPAAAHSLMCCSGVSVAASRHVW